jgi:hypothetical protein
VLLRTVAVGDDGEQALAVVAGALETDPFCLIGAMPTVIDARARLLQRAIKVFAVFIAVLYFVAQKFEEICAVLPVATCTIARTVVAGAIKTNRAGSGGFHHARSPTLRRCGRIPRCL